MSKTKKVKVTPTRILLENPYDLETFFESLNVASNHEKELLYIDRFIAALRSNPTGDITTINYAILKDLGIIKL
jgi:hypothetical protein